jgi:hypothetical protein
MKLKPIVNQLRAVLPKFTDKFGDTTSITSLTSSGSTATATSVGHGFSVGDYKLIQGAKIPYLVSSMTRVGTQVTVITDTTNQVVYQENDTIEITGANEDYNGIKTLVEPKKIKISNLTKVGNTITATTEEEHGFIVDTNFKINVWGSKEAIYNQNEIVVASVPTTTSFTYIVEGEITSPATPLPQIYCQAIYTPYTFFFATSGTPSSPATGTIYQLLSLNGGYNGFYEIASVPTDDTFTYTMNLSSLNSPAQGTVTATTTRIDSGISASRVAETYTKKSTGEYWLFVIPNSEVTSKNTRETTDANYRYTTGSAYNQILIGSFDLLLFIPTTNSLANGDSWDLAEDMKPFIFKSIVGVSIDSDFSNDNTNTTTGISYIGASPEFLDQKAFYAHRFAFEITGKIQQADIIDQNDFFAFRRITERYLDSDKDYTGLNTDIILN